MYERDGHTHRHTLHDSIGRACIASRGKKVILLLQQSVFRRFAAKDYHLFLLKLVSVDICCSEGVILSPYNCSLNSMEVFNIIVLRTRRLRWYGHVQRATSCINSITRLGLPGTRDRGRPRKTWSAGVRNDMTICNLDGVNPLDRNSRRTSVRRCQVLPTPESGTTAAP